MQTYPTGPGYGQVYTTPATAGYFPPVDEGITTEQQIRIEACYAASKLFEGTGANEGTRFLHMCARLEKWITEGKA